jgi:hypothetical protein
MVQMTISALEFAQMRERTEAARRRKLLVTQSIEESQAWIDLQARENVKPHRVKQSMKNNTLRDVPEKEIQDDIEKYLRLNSIYFVRSRMDRKTTTEPGTPDFVICRPCTPCVGDAGFGITRPAQFIALEVKRPGELPTSEQTVHAQRIQASGGKWAVVHSLDEAIKALLIL